jgi:glycosyltransferase involved in cell wall biosynthesis
MTPLVERQRAYMLRMPGLVAIVLWSLLGRAARAYGVEVIGDPATVLGAGHWNVPGWATMRWSAARVQRDICHHAALIAYVTRRYLQQRYPAGPHAWTTNYSSIELGSDAFVSHPRDYARRPQAAHIVSVGSMNQRGKGQHVLIDALAACRRQGLPYRLTLVGDGRYRAALRKQVVRHGMEDAVHFAGRLPAGAAVRSVLDEADLFALATFSEGLPRALVEAQARGVPCLATSVGGLPDVLDATEMVRPGDAHRVALELARLLSDPARLTQLSAVHLRRAREYSADHLVPRRQACYERLRAITQSPVDLGRREAA